MKVNLDFVFYCTKIITMNTIEKINMRIDHLRNKSTRENRRCIIKKFIEQVGTKEVYDEYDALTFFDYANVHYKGQSVLLVYSIIKWLYARMGFNFSDIEYPEYTNTNIYVMPKLDIKKLIQRIDDYSIKLKMLIAVSTTYGTRRIEMSQITGEDINLDDDKLFIRTAKSGKKSHRWMYIPHEIKPVLSEFKDKYPDKRSISAISASAYFWKACNIANVTLDFNQRIGWHSIRRSLIIELTTSGLTDNTIIQFMRWKSKNPASSILYRYRSTQDNDDVIENIDKEVTKVHPFLPYWNTDE